MKKSSLWVLMVLLVIGGFLLYSNQSFSITGGNLDLWMFTYADGVYSGGDTIYPFVGADIYDFSGFVCIYIKDETGKRLIEGCDDRENGDIIQEEYQISANSLSTELCGQRTKLTVVIEALEGSNLADRVERDGPEFTLLCNSDTNYLCPDLYVPCCDNNNNIVITTRGEDNLITEIVRSCPPYESCLNGDCYQTCQMESDCFDGDKCLDNVCIESGQYIIGLLQKYWLVVTMGAVLLTMLIVILVRRKK